MTTKEMMQYLLVKHLKAEGLGEPERKWMEKMEKKYQEFLKKVGREDKSDKPSQYE